VNAVLRECAVSDFTRNTGKEKERDAASKPVPGKKDESERDQAFWQWFAVGLLLFCWCAEASMCAQRGF